MTNEELERAVDRLKADLTAPRTTTLGSITVFGSDLRALLSERAELLAAVERLEAALARKADEGMLVLETLAALSPNYAHRHVKEGLRMARLDRAALTTGEGK